MTKQIRLHKYLADCGIASRRSAEKLIAEGRVIVDDQVVASVGVKIDPDCQVVMYEGKRVTPMAVRHFYVMNKPRGIICTAKDERGRKTVYSLLPECKTRLNYVGRLDSDSEGLLIFTDCGELVYRLTHPRYHVGKTYRVWCDRTISDVDLKAVLQGISDAGDHLRAISCVEIPSNDNPCYEIVLGEGRNRHIRRMLAGVGVRVVRLVRIKMGPITLNKLRVGHVRPLSQKEVAALFQAVEMTE